MVQRPPVQRANMLYAFHYIAHLILHEMRQQAHKLFMKIGCKYIVVHMTLTVLCTALRRRATIAALSQRGAQRSDLPVTSAMARHEQQRNCATLCISAFVVVVMIIIVIIVMIIIIIVMIIIVIVITVLVVVITVLLVFASTLLVIGIDPISPHNRFYMRRTAIIVVIIIIIIVVVVVKIIIVAFGESKWHWPKLWPHVGHCTAICF